MAKTGRPDKMVISNVVDNLEKAKETAIALVGENKNINYIKIFDAKSLETVETSIVQLNEYSEKCWLLSALLLYTLVYDKAMYTQSGLTWQEYTATAKKRLNMDNNEIAEQLGGARFFIKYHKDLLKQGWSPAGSSRKMARAEYALELVGNEKEVIKHIINDSWREFNAWYTSYKLQPALPVPTEYKRNDIKITKKDGVTIKGIKAITISDEIPEQDRIRLEKYITQIAEALKDGYEPAIVPVYDTKEANNLFRLRDKYRAGK